MSLFSDQDHETAMRWQQAGLALQGIDLEPPVPTAAADVLLARIGRRAENEPLDLWLRRLVRRPVAAPPVQQAEIIAFDARRQRFRPVADFVRLAADSGGPEIALPAHPLDTEDGRFRLAITEDEGMLTIKIQALGHASDGFAGEIVGLSSAAGEDDPLLLVLLDEDGDGETRRADDPALRRALLRPTLGVVEDL
jgi:hypothetical protein